MASMERLELLDRMRSAPVLRAVPLPELGRLAERSEVREFAPGEVLLEDGKPASEVYLVLEGTVAICKGGEETVQRKIATRSDADWLGETGALEAGVSTATVIAEERVRALVVSRETFLDVVTRHPPAVLDLLRSYISRLRESDARLIDALDARVRTLGSTNRRLERENRRLLVALDERHGFEAFVGSSPAARHVRDVAQRASEGDLPVLLLGETGTGKELLARAIHQEGGRSGHPFVAVNCALLSPQLLESELFGHARGAFTGATKHKLGLVEAASGGTLLLDEVGDMPGAIQAALLRFLECGEFRRLGEVQLRRADVRVIAATNCDFDEAVRTGAFRADLAYRLDVMRIEIPPLRERGNDVALLASDLVKSVAERLGVPELTLGPTARQALSQVPFPGNVRELQNEIERLYATVPHGSVVSAEDLSPRILTNPSHIPTRYADAVRAFKSKLVQDALRECDGNRARAAAHLGLHRSNLVRMLRDLPGS